MKRPLSIAWLLVVGVVLVFATARKGAGQRVTPEWSMTPQYPGTPGIDATRTAGTTTPETPRPRFTRTPGLTPTPSAGEPKR
ncbi:MAG TPA: hypothetical protein VIB08_06675 [Thermoanaerobaculia bacterium]|jgi:hypothetical protein